MTNLLRSRKAQEHVRVTFIELFFEGQTLISLFRTQLRAGHPFFERSFECSAVPIAGIGRGLIGALQEFQERRVWRRGGSHGIVGQEKLAQILAEENARARLSQTSRRIGTGENPRQRWCRGSARCLTCFADRKPCTRTDTYCSASSRR